jgi:hypothetical protein
LWVKDQEALQREFLQGVGLSLEQPLHESKIETTIPMCKRFVVGQQMIKELQFDEATQT